MFVFDHMMNNRILRRQIGKMTTIILELHISMYLAPSNFRFVVRATRTSTPRFFRVFFFFLIITRRKNNGLNHAAEQWRNTTIACRTPHEDTRPAGNWTLACREPYVPSAQTPSPLDTCIVYVSRSFYVHLV